MRLTPPVVSSQFVAHTSVRLRGIAAALLVTGVGLGVTGCGKKEEPAKETPTPAPATPVPAPEAPKPPPAPEKPATPPAPPPPAPATPPPASATTDSGPSEAEVAQRVSVFKAFHPFYSAGQMLQVPQFSSQLERVLDAIAKDPALLDRVRKAQTVQAPAGNVRVDLKVTDYSLPFANRLLAAVLSGSPVRLVDLVLNNASSSATFVLSPAPAK